MSFLVTLLTTLIVFIVQTLSYESREKAEQYAGLAHHTYAIMVMHTYLYVVAVTVPTG